MKKILLLFFVFIAINAAAQNTGDVLKPNTNTTGQQNYTPVQEKDFADEYAPADYPGWQYEKPYCNGGPIIMFTCPITRDVDGRHFYDRKPKAWFLDASGEAVSATVVLGGMALTRNLDAYFLTPYRMSGKWALVDEKEQIEGFRYFGPITLTGGILQKTQDGHYVYVITFN